MKSQYFPVLATLALAAAATAPAGAVTRSVTSWVPMTNCVQNTYGGPAVAYEYKNRGLERRDIYYNGPMYVFCSVNPTGAATGATSITIYLYQWIAGNGFRVNCSLVNGVSSAPVFSTKTSAFLPTDGSPVSLTWTPADLGSGTYFPNSISSIYCSLYGGEAIEAVAVTYPVEIGN